MITTYGTCPVCERRLGVSVGGLVPNHEYRGAPILCEGSGRNAR